jgi:hypothetical protein
VGVGQIEDSNRHEYQISGFPRHNPTDEASLLQPDCGTAMSIGCRVCRPRCLALEKEWLLGASGGKGDLSRNEW